MVEEQLAGQVCFPGNILTTPLNLPLKPSETRRSWQNMRF